MRADTHGYGSRRSCRRANVRHAVMMTASLFGVTGVATLCLQTSLLITQAHAGNYDDRNDRSERLQRQFEERQQRAEERRQRAEERRQRAEERQQRMLERQQRETERAQAAAERAQAASERAQAAAERTPQRAEPVSRDTSSTGRASVSSRDTSDTKDTNSRSTVQSSRDDKNSDTRKKDNAKDQDDNKDQDDSKDQNDDKEKSDQDAGTDSTNGDLAADDDQPEPTTLVEWFGKLTNSKTRTAHGHGKGKGRDKDKDQDAAVSNANPNTVSGVTGTAGANNIQPAGQIPKGKANGQKAAAASSTTAPPANAGKRAAASSRTAPDGSPKRGIVDFELLRMGSFRRHEIVASGLGPDSSERLRALGFQTTARVFAPGDPAPVQRLVVPNGMSEKSAVALLEKEVPSARFGPNHVYRILPAADGQQRSYPVKTAVNGGREEGSCVDDKCFARQLMHWKSALNACARRARVGIIDTSFDTSHPAFAGRRIDLQNFRGQSSPASGDWHGTAVLSVLAGRTDSGTPGLVPDADFLLASTFSTDADGQVSADAVAVLRALAWLDSQNADIVNMSFSGPPNDQIESVISAMAAKGVIFVAAAGNRGANGPASYPAAYKQVIAVTAISKDMRNYRHANRGDYVDVAAPGVNIWTALPNAREGYRTGTSFAAPFVTGLLAAMPEARKNIRTKDDVLARVSMQDLGPPGRDPTYGEGLPLAPESCNEVGGVASLPWTNEAKQMSVGGAGAGSSGFEPAALPPDTSGAAMSAFGFAQ